MNSKLYFEDIICARITPSGTSAVAMIRVSGCKCWQILDKIFQKSNKEIYKSHSAYYGKIIRDDKVIDNVIVLKKEVLQEKSLLK